ncbi:MAG: hypothetical protein A2017_05190 [Lentisphaerae bacterium GWF2_44_16]|nr:MAG: hypothetical protein A2017_05190 [Lentisphaerae bacterium GWF2_44_16]
MNEIIVRFAPSPTGQVHIGNIRAAIFNWLFARHNKGSFLLRVEDTDIERSTKEAIDALLDCMNWLGLNYDGEILYQTSRAKEHIEAALKMKDSGNAYYPPAKDGEKTPLVFRIPWDCENISAVRNAGNAEIDLSPDTPVLVNETGITFAQLSKKGAPVQRSSCLSGFREMKLFNSSGNLVFELEKEIGNVLDGKASFSFDNCSKVQFLRREVVFTDIIKGELAKPLDSMKDLVIVRSDGTPVFHMANVCDDIIQKVTHIIRGDDHVENTYRHIFLFSALDYPVPQYAHLPMIVNASGKPYSKRDGDAFVGDFRDKGYFADALFNYLALLGWSPGDDREKLSKDELVELFSLERVKSAPAQFDINKLFNMNGLYLAEMPQGTFTEYAWDIVKSEPWVQNADKKFFERVAALLQSRTKLITQVKDWGYFFTDDVEYDLKAAKKNLGKEDVKNAIQVLLDSFASSTAEFTLQFIEEETRKAEKTAGLAEGKLNQPLRIAATGCSVGAGIYETIHMLGKTRTIARLKKALSLNLSE